MKQARKILSVISVAILLCIAFTACGDSSDDPVVGTWEMTSVSAMDQEMSAADFLKATNYTELPVITFNGDNTVDVNILGNQKNSKWELKDGKYHVTDNNGGTSLDFTLENNKLSTEQSGGKLVFEKKK